VIRKVNVMTPIHFSLRPNISKTLQGNSDMQMAAEKTRDRQQWKQFVGNLSVYNGGDGKQASKLTNLSDTNFIMLLYREALDRLHVRSNIILSTQNSP